MAICKKTLAVALKFVSHASGVKDVRYYLNGVLFELRPSRLTLVATDGHRLAIATIDGQFGDVYADVVLSNDSVKSILSQLKLSPCEKIEVGCDENNTIKVETSTGGATYKGVECKYPDWRRVMPQGEPVPTATISLPAPYLAEVGKAAAPLGLTKYPALKIELRGATCCAWIEPQLAKWAVDGGLTECGALIMPVRV